MQQGDVIINVDWLAISVRFGFVPNWDTVCVPPEYKLVRQSGTKVWHDRVILCTHYGDKVATILSRPKSQSLFESGAGLVEVANEWLYHGAGWPLILHDINRICPMEILNLSRVDICTDFCPNAQQQDVILGLRQGKYYITGKSNGADFWSSSGQDVKLAPWVWNKKIPHQQSWGHKTSDVKWKLYYKTKELLQVEDKPYIREHWEHAGFDVTNVWRLEVSIKYPHHQLLADRPITYDIFNHEWHSIMRTFYQQRFVVRRAEHHKDRSNDTIIDFIPDLNKLGVDLKWRQPVSSRQRYGRITLLRKLVQACGDDAVRLNDNCREQTFALIEQIVTDDQLQNYFEAMTGSDLYTWIENVRCEAYTLCGVAT